MLRKDLFLFWRQNIKFAIEITKETSRENLAHIWESTVRETTRKDGKGWVWKGALCHQTLCQEHKGAIAEQVVFRVIVKSGMDNQC